MGIAGLGCMGLLVKVAFDSDPNLARLGKVKKAFADSFGPRGLSEFTIHTLPRKAGYKIRAAVEAEPGDPDVLTESLARSFVENFEGSPRSRVAVELYQVAGGLGCHSETLVVEREFTVPELRRWNRIREAGEELVGQVIPGLGLEIVQSEPRGRSALTLILVPSEPGSLPADPGPQVAERLRGHIFRSLKRAPVRTVHLVLRSSLDVKTPVKEFELERPASNPAARPRWRPPTPPGQKIQPPEPLSR